MSTVNEIRLKLTIDGREAVAALELTDENIERLVTSLQDANARGKKLGDGMVTSLENARNAIQGLKEIGSLIQGIFAEQIRLSGIQEQAEARLGQAMRSAGTYTEAGYNSLKDYASALQSVTVYGDEAILGQMSFLASLGMSEGQMKRLTAAAADLAAGTGVSLESAVRNLAKTYGGLTGELGELLPGLKDLTEEELRSGKAIEYVTERFKGQAKTVAETASGAIAQFNNLVGDLREKAGSAALNGIGPLVDHISDLANTLNGMPQWLSGGTGALGMLTAAFIVLRTTGIGKTAIELVRMGPTLASTGVMAAAAIPPVTGLGGAFRSAGAAAKGFMASLGPLGWAMVGLAVLLEAATFFDVFSDSAEGAGKSVDGLNEKFKGMDNSGLKRLIGDTNGLLAENRQKVEELRAEYQRIATTDWDTVEKRKKALESLAARNAEINDRLGTQQKLQVYLNELQAEYNARNREALAMLSSQLEQVKAKAAAGDLTGSRDKELGALKTSYLKEKEIVEDALAEGMIAEAEGQALLSKLRTQHERERMEVILKYAKEKVETRTQALLSELRAEEDHSKRMLELAGAGKNEILEAEIGFLERRKQILQDGGQKYLETENEIEEKRLEILLNREDAKLRAADREIENRKRQSDNELRITGATDEERIRRDIEYYEEKIGLFKSYSMETTDLELELSMARAEFEHIRSNKGKASDEYKAQLEDVLRQEGYRYAEERRLADEWRDGELQKYRNDEEAKALIHEVYSKRRNDIDEAEADTRMAVQLQAFSILAGAYAKHTAVSKAASVAVAFINTYEAATKALTAGPVLGPILAALITAAGLANIAKILSVETPQATGYAKGGMAMIGEDGPELIAPASDYAEGQRLLAEKVARSVANSFYVPVKGDVNGVSEAFAEDLLKRLDGWKSRLEFRISRGDLYSSWEGEERFRKRNG